MNSESLAVGIVGCGRIAERHAEAYRRLADVRGVVVVDADATAANRLASRFNTEVASSVEAILDRDDVTAVDICVPTPFHADLVLRALEAGKHVFCEKPLCDRLEDALAIQSAQQASGLHVMVGYLYRFHPAYRFAREVMDDDVLGLPHLAICRLGGRGDTSPWKHQAGEGGGAVLEMMVHGLDLIQYLLGPIQSIDILAERTLLPRRTIRGEAVDASAEDYVLARVRAGSVEAVCESDVVTPSYMNYFEIQGANGSLFTSILDHMPTSVYCREPRGVFNLGTNYRSFGPVNLFDLELGHFVKAILGDEEFDYGLDASVEVLAQLERAREAVAAPPPLANGSLS